MSSAAFRSGSVSSARRCCVEVKQHPTKASPVDTVASDKPQKMHSAALDGSGSPRKRAFSRGLSEDESLRSIIEVREEEENHGHYVCRHLMLKLKLTFTGAEQHSKQFNETVQDFVKM